MRRRIVLLMGLLALLFSTCVVGARPLIVEWLAYTAPTGRALERPDDVDPSDGLDDSEEDEDVDGEAATCPTSTPTLTRYADRASHPSPRSHKGPPAVHQPPDVPPPRALA